MSDHDTPEGFCYGLRARVVVERESESPPQPRDVQYSLDYVGITHYFDNAPWMHPVLSGLLH